MGSTYTVGSTVEGRHDLIATGAIHQQEPLKYFKTGWDTNLTLLNVSIENPSCRGSQELSWSGWLHRPGDGQVALLPGLSCSMRQNKEGHQGPSPGQHGLSKISTHHQGHQHQEPKLCHLSHICSSISGWHTPVQAHL